MRSLKLAEKQNNLKSLLDTIQTHKQPKDTLPTISERDQRSSRDNENYFSWQASPKIFINSEEALIWIKKDVDKRTRHDFFQMIKRRAEKQMTLQRIPNAPVLESKQKRNFNSHTIRKYSSTSRCHKDNTKRNLGEFSLLNRIERKNAEKKSNPHSNHFLSIRIVEASAATSKSNVKNRMKTSKAGEGVKILSLKQEQHAKANIKVKSEGKLVKKKKELPDSFDSQYLSPW